MKKSFKILALVITIIIIVVSGVYFFVNRDVHIVKNSETDFSQKNQKESLGWEKKTVNNVIVFSSSESGYSLGLSKGTALQDEIQDIVNILNTDIFPEGMAGNLAKTVSLLKAKQFWENIPTQYQLEIKGVADGANVNINDVLLVNIFDDISNVLGCSSMVIPKGDKSDFVIHARNLDYNLPQLAGKNIVYIQQDKSKNFTFLTIGYPGYIGALTGVNSSGISLSNHTSSTYDINTGEPTGITYRQILERSKSLSDVENILKNTNKTQGNNLMVGSVSENTAAVFELTANHLEKRSLSNHCLTTTNHFQNKKMQTLFNQSWDSSILRNDTMQKFCDENIKINYENVSSLMSFFDSSLYGWQTLANRGTIQAVIMIPELKQIYVANGSEPPVNQEGYTLINY